MSGGGGFPHHHHGEKEPKEIDGPGMPRNRRGRLLASPGPRRAEGEKGVEEKDAVSGLALWGWRRRRTTTFLVGFGLVRNVEEQPEGGVGKTK